MSKYKFNKEQLRFVEEKLGLTGRLKMFLKYLVGSILLAVLYYLIFAAIFNTGEEERLLRENRMLNEEYKRAVEKLDIIDNVILDLQKRDREIYMSIFQSSPPELLSEYNPRLYIQLDTSSDVALVNYSANKLNSLKLISQKQERRIAEILNALQNKENLGNIPSIMPIKGMTISQTGASIGDKIHPFYKTMSRHTGIDLLAGLGTEVIATADGYVTNVERSDRGRGNQITILHGNGYETYYAHLGEMLVRRGQNVKRGQVIARVGSSGLSFAPHLHYEVRLDGNIMDPVNYFFSELRPSSYREMMIIALNSGQSMD